MNTSIPGIGSLSPIGSLQTQSPMGAEPPEGGFSGFLSSALNQVSELNAGAQQQIGNVLAGHNGDLSSVMIAVEKADVAFQLMMQVRNKIVGAYQDIEKMQF